MRRVAEYPRCDGARRQVGPVRRSALVTIEAPQWPPWRFSRSPVHLRVETLDERSRNRLQCATSKRIWRSQISPLSAPKESQGVRDIFSPGYFRAPPRAGRPRGAVITFLPCASSFESTRDPARCCST